MNGNDTYLDVNNAHLRVTSGNVHASGFNLDQISIVTTSNTGSTINFLNDTKGFMSRSNIEVGTANLFVDTTTSRVGIGTDAPAYTLDVHGSANVGTITTTDINVTGNLTVLGTTTTVDTDNLRVKDPIIELGKDNAVSPVVDLGLILTRPTGSSNVAIIYDESTDNLEIGYTQGNASQSIITMETAAANPISVNVNGTISGNGSGLTALPAAQITGTLDAARIPTLNQSTTGSAATLTTPRSIGGVNFDGSANITLPGVNSGGNQNTSGSAATLTTARTIGGVNFDGSAAIVPTTFGVATFSGDVTVDSTTFHVDSTNNRVGIGTTTPQYRLDVGSGGGDVMLRVMNGLATTGKLLFGRSGTADNRSHAIEVRNNGGGDNNYMKFLVHDGGGSPYEGRTEVMTLRGDGRVGIGTSSPTEALQVYGDGTDPTYIRVVGKTSNRSGIMLSEENADNNVIMEYDGTGSGAGNYLAFYSGVSSWAAKGTGLNFVPENGRVGIGTANPDNKLEISDLTSTNPTLLKLTCETAASPGESNTAIQLSGTSGGGYGGYIEGYLEQGVGSGLKLGHINSSQVKTEHMRIIDSGNVGIGTTDPSCKLTVGDDSVSVNSGGGVLGIRQKGDTLNDGITLTSSHANSTRIFKDGSGHFTIQNTGGGTLTLENVTGNVGIGTTSPGSTLTVGDGVNPTSGDAVGSITVTGTGSTKSLPGKPGIYHRAGVGLGLWSDAHMSMEVDGTNGIIEAMRIKNNGNVGIGTTDPLSKLQIKPNHTSYSNPAATSGLAIYNETNSDPSITHSILNLRTGGSSGGDPFISYDIYAEHGWSVGIDNSVGRQLRFGESWSSFSSTRAYISSGSTANEIDFTGQHRSFISNVPHTEYLNLEGLIVSANKNQYFDIQEEIVTGVQAIKINESLPLVSISNVAYDKCCFGVISGSEDTNDREYSQGSFVSVLKKQDGDIRAHINSVGEGAIWVTNLNGTLESGDYITTSNVAGYGQKQDSEFLANYTVAKITMDCDFNPSTQPNRNIKRELRDVNYWVKYTYDDISEEEYTRVKNLGRRVRIIESGTEISQEEYENHLKKEGYTETESNTYIRNDTTYQRVFSDKEKEPTEGYELEVRNEPVNILDEHGQIQWEDHPTETEKAYKIRHLDANGVITDEANAVHTAAFVGCTYHCG